MSHSPAISVIIPVYNVESWLRRAVGSLQNQTCTSYEILLVDDGSTDGSGALCDKLADDDVRIRVIHQENQGAAAARNAAIEIARGDYLYFMDGDDFGRDPMTGFMTALSNSPDASTEFFNAKEPQDNAAWVLKERPSFDDTPLSDGPSPVLEATGAAMFAAVSGVGDPDAPGAEFAEHTPEQDEAMKRSLKYLAATGNDFPSEIRDDMARAMGNHGETVHKAMSDPLGSHGLDAGDLMEVSKQISRNKDTYGLLTEQMNNAMMADILTEQKHPEDSLDKAGRTVGFLEEARYQATNDKKDGDITDASWKKAWTYHLVGGVLTPIGGGLIGDPLQRGVDAITTAWLQDKTNEINATASADHKETYEARNGQLRALADEWYKVNSDWAEDPAHEGYSKDHGVYSSIGASANDGNKKAEGVAGDQ